MRIDNLNYIIEIAKLGSISSAAKKLWIGPTSLSAVVRSIEQELGVKLFVRSPKGLALTEAGRELLPQMNRVAEEYQNLLNLASDPTDSKTVCTVGCFPALAPLLGSYTAQRMEGNGTYKLNVKSIISRKIIQSVADGIVDIAVGTLPLYHKEEILMQAKQLGIGLEILSEDCIHLCVSGKSPLADKKEVDIEEIKEMQLCSASFFPQFTNTYPFIDYNLFSSHCVFDDMESLKKTIGNTNTIAFLPSIVFHDDIYIEHGVIRNILLTGGDYRLINFMVYAGGEKIPRISQSVIEIIQDFFHEYG